MKKTLLYIFALLMLTSCFSQHNYPMQDYYPFKESNSDKWGLIDANGEVLVSDEFKEEPEYISNGMFFVPTDKGYQMYSVSSPTIPVGDFYKYVAPFSSNLAPVVKENEGIKVIDKNGDVQFELPVVYTDASSFIYGYLIASNKETSLQEAFSTSGERFHSNKYSIQLPLPGNRFLAEDVDGDNVYILNNEMERISRLCEVDDFLYITPDQKYFVYEAEDGWGIKNFDGEVVLRPKYDTVLYFSENCIIVENDEGLFGVINIQGDNLIRPKYEDILSVKKDRIAFYDEDKDKVGLINLEGETVLSFDFDEIYAFPNSDKFLVTPYDDDYCYFVDKNGKKIDNKEYYYIDIDADVTGDIGELSLLVGDFDTVNSDYLDYEDIISAMLNMTSGPMSLFKDYVGMSPSDVCDELDLSLSYYDIEEMYDLEWFPEKSFESERCEEYGTLSYQLGFDEIVEDYGSRYYFSSNGVCKSILISLDLYYYNMKSEDSMNKGIRSALAELGYKSGKNDYTMSNGKYSVRYSYLDYGEIHLIVQPD